MQTRIKPKLLAALVLCWGLILFPAEAVSAAKDAILTWATAYAPAMLPFFIILPVLASEDAAALYDQLFGPLMRRLFGIPGRAAGAAVLGLIAGSPAGATALVRLADPGMTRGELSRAALLCCGLSPLFLISGIGVSILGSAAAGHVLMRSQLGAVLLSGLIFRFAWRRDTAPVAPEPGAASAAGVREAALSVLTVCGYMMLFSVIARLTVQLLGAQWEPLLLALIEVAGGSEQLARLPVHPDAALVLIAACVGLSGAAILVQNAGKLRPLGLPWHRLALGKAMQSALCALLCGLQLRMSPNPAAIPALVPAYGAERAAMAAGLLLIAVGFGIVMVSRRRV